MGRIAWACLLGALLVTTACLGERNEPGPLRTPDKEPIGTASASKGDADRGPTGLGTINGQVTDDELNPIAGATVTLTTLDVNVRTAANGSFQFTEVPVGTHTIETQARGHLGKAIRVTVQDNQVVDAAFALSAIPVKEPTLEVLHHVTLVYYGGAGLSEVAPYVPEAPLCSDACQWWVQPDVRPDVVYSETFGAHSIPNPRGWDGFRIVVYGFSLNDTNNRKLLWSCNGTLDTEPNAECLRLPVRFAINGSSFANEDDPSENVVERLRFTLACEQTWICVEDRYETYVSLFLNWGREEVPPGYSARPDG